MHITLTGNLGSGKSTICKILEEQYGFEICSTGAILRKLAEERGVSVLEMNQIISSDPSYDHMIDDITTRISRERPNDKIVFDSRLAWHFAEKSFKVFLSVDIDEAARRVYGDNRGNVEKYRDEADAKKQLIARAANEDARYKETYHINYFDFNNYNLVLDSTYCTPQFLAERILAEHDEYVAGTGFYASNTCKMLVSPARVMAPGSEKAFEKGPKEAAVAYDPQLLLPCRKAENGNFELLSDTKISSEYPLLQLILR